MKTSAMGMREIASLEGISTKVYLDSVGVRTIGIGATRSEIPDIRNWSWDVEIGLDDVVQLFRKSLVKYEDAVNRALKVDITQYQFDALVSFCYNVGTGGMSKSTLLKRINNNEGMSSIGRAFMMWTKPKEITGRRTKEMKLYTTGKYSNNGTALLFPVSSVSHKPIYSKGKSVDITQYFV